MGPPMAGRAVLAGAARADRQRGGEAIRVEVAGAEVRVEHPRALQVEVHVDLPREAHAAVHLGRGLAVRDRGLARQQLRGRRSRGRGPRDRVRRGAHRPRRPRPARPRCARSMSAQRCLIAWNDADRPVELLALLRVRDRQLGAAVGDARAANAAVSTAPAPLPVRRRRTSIGVAGGQRRRRARPV